MSAPNIGMGIGQAGNAVSDIFGGIEAYEGDQIKAEGLQAEATNYTEAAVLAGQNEQFTVQSTAVQQYQAHRNLEQAQGTTAAEIGAAGETTGGSAQDIIRGNVQQGAIQKQIVGQQGLITEAGYTEQQQADTTMANYANSAAGQEKSLGTLSLIGGIVGGIFQGGASAASLGAFS